MPKRNLRSKNKFTITPIDMGSMLDMIFILLLFIMLSVSFSDSHSVMDLELPQAISKGSSPNNGVEIFITKNGEYLDNNATIPLNILEKNAIAGMYQNKAMIISADKTAPMQSFVSLIEILKKGNISELKLGIRK